MTAGGTTIDKLPYFHKDVMDDTPFDIAAGSVILVKKACFFIKMYYSIIIILFNKIGENG
jgi:hypothetical protein